MTHPHAPPPQNSDDSATAGPSPVNTQSSSLTTALRSPTSPNGPRMRGSSTAHNKLSMLSLSRVTGSGNGPPSSGLYERLETGDENDQRSGQKRVSFAWRKFAIAAAVLIGLVWLFGPRERRQRLLGSSPGSDSSSTSEHRLSIETDPDPAKTTYCTQKHPSAPRLVQWALMIDAGSTGSRIHAYKFNYCTSTPVYEYEVFDFTKPGLSDYSEDPEAAAKSLDKLLDLAVKSVPPELHKCTPVAVKATAGLRALGNDKSNEILRAVQRHLETAYPFPVLKKDGVVIMDGKDEGVYAWLTVNYLLDALKPNSPGYAVLDLGGGSTQIVFEPLDQTKAPVVEGEHMYKLTFGSTTRELYQHSYLGYGLKSARLSIHKLVHFMHTLTNSKAPGDKSKDVPKVLEGDRNVTMMGGDVGSFEGCRRVIELVLAKDAVCQVKPCSFNGVYQPSLLDAFAGGRSCCYRTLTTGCRRSSQRARSLLARSRTSRRRSVPARRRGRSIGTTTLTRFYGSAMNLRTRGPVRTEKKLQDTELGWCLGATMVMIAGDLECRI
ncbi:nucleoside phosphatase family-domain-containing protein [Auriculariales sp. MPI-PUGE-AT-0066]|nr:nucleoside phosphatase family-domain-containing protein [Auriculariales sp. MPI-PUGE-AT-0066]